MTYIVINQRTGKPVKNAITRKPFLCESLKQAEILARDSEVDSVLSATAWNSIRPSKYIVREFDEA